MAFTRTRIWHGGNAQLGLPPGGNAQPGLPPDAPEPGSVPLTPVPASPRRREAQQRVTPAGPAEFPSGQAPSSDFIPGFAPGAAREQAATRFMPIEELFPELTDDAPHAAQAGRHANARRPERPLVETPTGLRGARRSRTRRWPILVLALASLALGTTLWSHDVRVELGARLARAGAAAASVGRSAPRPPPEASGGDELREPKPHAPEPERAGAGSAKSSATTAKNAAHAPDGRAASAPTPGLERAAIDVLIAGDVARAEQLYARLARGAAPEAIREALRILASRHDVHAP
jgi:hypothetical protein